MNNLIILNEIFSINKDKIILPNKKNVNLK